MSNTAFTLMIGASIHAATQTRQTRSATWGVALTGANFAGTWGPPGPKGATPAGAMSTYTFRIYLLPPPGSTSNLPPNYWTTELLAGLTNPGRPLPLIASQKLLDPITVSPGSGPWKIMYEVITYDAVPLLGINSATPTAGSTVTVTGKYFGMGQPSVELILTPIGSGTVLWNEPAVTLDPNGNFGEYEERAGGDLHRPQPTRRLRPERRRRTIQHDDADLQSRDFLSLEANSIGTDCVLIGPLVESNCESAANASRLVDPRSSASRRMLT